MLLDVSNARMALRAARVGRRPVSSAEHPVDVIGDVMPEPGRPGCALGDCGSQRLRTDPGDVDLVPPLLDLVVQRVGNLDRVTGHRYPPCSWLGRRHALLQGREAGLPRYHPACGPRAPLLSSQPTLGLSNPINVG